MNKGFETDYWKAPVLMYFKKFKYEGFFDFLKKLDNKLSTDWITGIVPSMRITDMNEIQKCIDEKSDYQDILNSNAFDIDKATFETVITGNIYGRKYARYLLIKTDVLMNSPDKQYNLPETISIEHILPQNPTENSQWKKDFTDEQREEWTDKIVNLTLISRRKNSSQGNLDYEKKYENYFKKNIETFPSMIKLFQENKEWKIDNLKKRQENVINLLLGNL